MGRVQRLNEAAALYQRAVQLGEKTASANLGRVQEKIRNAGQPVRR